MLTDIAINDFKTFFIKNILYATAIVDGIESKYPITKKEKANDDTVVVYIQIAPQASKKVTIQKINLYNQNRELWVSKEENIVLNKINEGTLYRFTFDFKEVQNVNV